MLTTVPANGSPVALYGRSPESGVTLRNTDTVNGVWLSDSNAPGSGTFLNALATITWAGGGKPLYAFTDASLGASVTLDVSEDISSLDDPLSLAIATGMTGAGIAAALSSNAGLNANGIAAALATNNALTAAGVAAAISAAGVPIIQVSTHTLSVVNQVTGNLGYQSAILDVRQFASLNLSFKPSLDVAGNHWVVIVDWFGDAAGTQRLRADNFTAYANANGAPTCYATMAAHGNYVRVSVYTDGSIINAFNLDLWGMSLPIAEKISSNNNGSGALAVTAGVAIAVGTSLDVYGAPPAGNQVAYFNTNSAGTAVLQQVLYLVNELGTSFGFREVRPVNENTVVGDTYKAPLYVTRGAAVHLKLTNNDTVSRTPTCGIIDVS